jgi:hypothetical protein
MEFPIQPGRGFTARDLLVRWSQLIHVAVQERFPQISVQRTEREDEYAVSLREAGKERGEIVVRWLPAGALSIFARPPAAPQTAAGDPDKWGWRAVISALIAVNLAWIAFLVWFWDIYWDIRGVRGKVFWLLVIVIGWLATNFGGALGADAAAKRLHGLVHKPRAPAPDPWIERELAPWLERYMDELRRTQPA